MAYFLCSTGLLLYKCSNTLDFFSPSKKITSVPTVQLVALCIQVKPWVLCHQGCHSLGGIRQCLKKHRTEHKLIVHMFQVCFSKLNFSSSVVNQPLVNLIHSLTLATPPVTSHTTTPPVVSYTATPSYYCQSWPTFCVLLDCCYISAQIH